MNEQEVNFNKTPKKGNIGLIIGIIVIIVVLGFAGIYFFGKYNSSNSEANKDNSASNSEFDNENINEEEPQYENLNLRIMDVFDDETTNNKIIDIVNNGTFTYLLTNDKKILYSNNSYGYTHILTANDNFKNIFQNSFEETVVIENKDDTYTVYEASNIENNMTIKAEGLVAAYWAYGVLSVFTLEDEKLYYTWYQEVDGNIESDKGHVIIDESSAIGQEDEIITYTGKIKYAKPTETNLAVIKEDGTAYNIELTNYNSIPEEGGYTFYVDNTYKIINNVDKIIADTAIIHYLKPVYSIKGDAKNIYVREIDYSSFSSIASPNVRKIALPDDYEISDIKSFYVLKEMILITNDGNVFYKENASEDTDWEKTDELTKLNQESHIVEIVDTYMDFLILCDDGYIYEYNK